MTQHFYLQLIQEHHLWSGQTMPLPYSHSSTAVSQPDGPLASPQLPWMATCFLNPTLWPSHWFWEIPQHPSRQFLFCFGRQTWGSLLARKLPRCGVFSPASQTCLASRSSGKWLSATSWNPSGTIWGALDNESCIEVPGSFPGQPFIPQLVSLQNTPLSTSVAARPKRIAPAAWDLEWPWGKELHLLPIPDLEWAWVISEEKYMLLF